ncbi:MAG: HDOD domain-containing protein [Planctomycetota bacterium]
MVAARLPKTRRIELILRQIDQLPTLPAVATRLLELTADHESRSDEVVQLVSSDPALTAKVLAMCRTADRGVRNADALTVQRAVLLLGYGQVRNLVLSLKIFELFDGGAVETESTDEREPSVSAQSSAQNPQHSPPAFDRSGFWAHCLGVAVAAERIAAASGDPQLKPDEAFVCGLLHDLGKLALAWVLPKAYDKVAALADAQQSNLSEHERALIGVDHHTAGKRLAEQWKLPHRLQDVMWLHGSPYDTLPKLPHRRMIGLVQLADLCVRQRHLGYSGNYAVQGDADASAEKIGIEPGVVREALGGLFEDVEQRAEAMGLGDQVSVDLYLRSVQRANEALGRSNEALERRAKSAAAQARVLGSIATFHAQARPGRSVQDVLDAVADSAAALLGEGFYAIIQPTRQSASAFERLSDPTEPGANKAALLTQAEALDDELADQDRAEQRAGFDDPAEANDAGRGVVEQAADGDAWLICQYDPQGQPRHAQYIDRPAGAPDLRELDPRHRTDMTLMGVLPWIADYLLEAEDLRKVSLVPLPSGWGTSALLLHDRGDLPGADALAPVLATWGTAIAAANQHDGARRLGEQLADASTKLAEAQALLARNEAMSRLGEMAAGAAHEMNNPLTVISGRSQMLTMALNAGTKEHQAAAAVFREAHRLSDLITALRMFADPPTATRTPTDIPGLLNRVVQKVGDAARKRREDLQFSIHSPGELPPCNIDSEQADRALTELLMNAVQADPKHGVVVKARVDHANTPHASLVLQVIDDGAGMDEHTLAHATDPFFSAKPAGRQVGMGLSRVAQLAEAHGGRIDLRSTPGRGTTATLTLPLH